MKISIVTATYNRKHMLKKAIESVLDQKADNIEHIIIDGASTDGSLEMLEKYKHLKVISEADKGVYEAMNKGIRAASGDIILLLNSDDFLEKDALKHIQIFFNKHPDCDYACGGTRILYPQLKQESILDDDYFKELKACNVTRGKIGFNAIVFKKHVFQKIGYLNDKYKIASDRDFVLRLTHTPGIKGKKIKENIYTYLSHDQSLTFGESIAKKTFFLELLDISHDGIKESKNKNASLCKAYKQWMSWAMIRYLFAPDNNNPSSVPVELMRATKADPFWYAKAMYEIYDHIKMKSQEKKNLKIIDNSKLTKAI